MGADVTVQFIWERDGNIIDSLEDRNELLLLIAEVEPVHAGRYTCRAELTPQTPGGIVTNLGPISGGSLTVLGELLHKMASHNVT